jgi:thiamine biosynthesis lipoprotein ApbE
LKPNNIKRKAFLLLFGIFIGGNRSIKVIGRGPTGHGWRVGIENPRQLGKIIGVINLKSGQAIGTSADTQRFFINNGRRYSHIIDPRTGYPTAKILPKSLLFHNRSGYFNQGFVH